MPVAREEHGVAVVGGLMFVVGGGAPTAARVDAFDPQKGTWTPHTALPVGMDHLSVAGVGDKLYVLGGTQSGNSWVYDPSTKVWTAKAPMPVHRAATAVGVIGTTIYIAGGYDQPRGVASATDFQAYDTATDSWKSSSKGELPVLEVPRNHVQGAVVDGRFYIMGGRVAQGGGEVYNRLDVYDPATNKWQARAPMARKRAAGAAAVVGNLIVFAVGEGNPTGVNKLFNVADAYDPASDQWTALAPLKVARHGLGAAGIGGKIYVVGGSTAMAGGSPVDVVEEFTP
jgi:N-acetylneuraminic acid mutarotase